MRTHWRSHCCPPGSSCAVVCISSPDGPAFSLIELLIVVALLMILTTMYWGFGSPSHQRQQKKLCEENLQKIYLAMQIYANDSHGSFPMNPGATTSEQVLDVLVPRYSVDTSIFICPGSKDSQLPSGENFRNRKISYAYYMGRKPSDQNQALMSDRQIDTKSKEAGEIVFSTTGNPPGNNHSKYGGNILFCDGHLESCPAQVPFSLMFTQGVELLNPRQ